MAEPTPEHRFLAFVRRHRELHRERNRVVRYTLVFVGFVVVSAGVALIVLPGPGFLVVAVGLTILALEFAWAERLLERTVLRLEQAGTMASNASRAQQLLIVGTSAIVAVAFVAAVIAWDLPLVPG